MVQWRKPDELSEHIIDRRWDTRDVATKKAEFFAAEMRRQQAEEFRRQREKELRDAVLRRVNVRRGRY